MVDKPKLDQILSNLRSYIGVLRTLAAVPRETFLRDHDKIGNAKYHLVIAIECCIDVANHIIASENYRLPRDNADSFTVLAEHGVVLPSLREALSAMARFRNRLVHVYWDVDDARVHEYLQEGLDELAAFGEAVARHSARQVARRRLTRRNARPRRGARSVIQPGAAASRRQNAANFSAIPARRVWHGGCYPCRVSIITPGGG